MRIASTTPVASTFSTESAVECGFDASGAAHIQQILTYLYRDAAMAVLREYAANALDSHVRAGTSAPVEIRLPSEWDPVLTVADRGVGLDEQGITEVYAPYGTSTKRDTEDADSQVGAFGIGAKAAFTLASQFTVTGVRDGKKVTALFALNEAGAATVEIMAREATDAPDGVTVVVPVPDPAAMRQAAEKLFAFWPAGSVLVDGEAPDYLPATMLPITGGLFADQRGSVVNHRDAHKIREDSATELTVVMGGIPYSASVAMVRALLRRAATNASAAAGAGPAEKAVHEFLSHLAAKQTGTRLVYLAEIGEVDITPSREDMRDTPRTLAVLERMVTTFVESAKTAVETALAAEPTALHASVRLADLVPLLPVGVVGRGEVRWREEKLAPNVRLPYPVIVRTVTEKSSRCTMQAGPEIRLAERLDDLRVITGVSLDDERLVRRWANRYMTHHDLTRLVLAAPPTVQVGWFTAHPASKDTAVTAVTFDQFLTDARALPKVTSTSRRAEYQVFHGQFVAMPRYSTQAQQWPVDRIDAWPSVTGGRGRVLLATTSYREAVLPLVNDALTRDDLVVTLTGQQTDTAFYRRVPHAVPLDTAVTDHAHTVLKNATEVEHLALNHVHDPALTLIQHMPELRRVNPLRQMITDYVTAQRAAQAVPTERRNLLTGACHLLNIGTANLSRAGLPLLDLVLDILRRQQTAAPVDPALVADLAAYLTTVTQPA